MATLSPLSRKVEREKVEDLRLKRSVRRFIRNFTRVSRCHCPSNRCTALSRLAPLSLWNHF